MENCVVLVLMVASASLISTGKIIHHSLINLLVVCPLVNLMTLLLPFC